MVPSWVLGFYYHRLEDGCNDEVRGRLDHRQYLATLARGLLDVSLQYYATSTILAFLLLQLQAL